MENPSPFDIGNAERQLCMVAKQKGKVAALNTGPAITAKKVRKKKCGTSY